jgi:DNA topoisomerase-1
VLERVHFSSIFITFPSGACFSVHSEKQIDMTRLSLPDKLARIQRDPMLTAKTAGLRYVSDTTPGWYRQKRGDKFFYVDSEGNKCKDEETLKRIRSLVLPPAWTDVWICSQPNGHLQATGKDAKGRKQYRYHPNWNNWRSQTKYFRLPQFAEALPLIRERTEADLKRSGIPFEKVLALVVRLIEQTNIRIGSESYKNLYGSFGLTTLQDRHVKVDGAEVKFQFKGKKGVFHTLSITDRRLARLVKQCRDIPGKELFQYIDEAGRRCTIDSGDVNRYLKDITGLDFTAKDFRTWSGSVEAYRALRDIGPAETAMALKKNVVQALDCVAGALGNTRTVCKNYYIHPAVMKAYERGELTDCRPQAAVKKANKNWLSEDEEQVQCLLGKYAWD